MMPAAQERRFSDWMRTTHRACALFVASLLAVAPAFAIREPRHPEPLFGDPGAPRATAERTGVLGTENGLKLRLSTDLGSVRILTLPPGAAPVVSYAVHIETDARSPLAAHLLALYAVTAKATPAGVQIVGALPSQGLHGRAAGAQFWVHFDVSVPRSYSVEISTGAGDIETQDLGGTATLVTQGGNIRCGRILSGGLRNANAGKPAARLETQGGHITVLDVDGDLDATTGGGHVNAGKVAGDARLYSGGGHIHAAQIGGQADLSTDGGNITVGQAASTVAVHTGGGQIDFGEVGGSVRAQTGGGGIRMSYVAGPMEVETSSGSICLTRVADAVRAATTGGSITAFINPDSPSQSGAVRLAGASQLSSGGGDIVVFLPRNLAATIEATVESGGANQIQADPTLPLKFETESTRAAGPVRATGALNGGGAVLRLRTGEGKIRLQYLDSDATLRESLIRQQAARISERLRESQIEPLRVQDPSQKPGDSAKEEKNSWIETWLETIEEKLRGGVREDAQELQKRALFSPPPAYPPLAIQAGVQGTVRLQVRVAQEGRVEVLKVLEGEPVLADAAISAVKQWRYKPRLMNGRRVNAISEVTFNFQLH